MVSSHSHPLVIVSLSAVWEQGNPALYGSCLWIIIERLFVSINLMLFENWVVHDALQNRYCSCSLHGLSVDGMLQNWSHYYFNSLKMNLLKESQHSFIQRLGLFIWIRLEPILSWKFKHTAVVARSNHFLNIGAPSIGLGKCFVSWPSAFIFA